jgi:nucleoside-diphosphate-sugar epimerase
MMTHHAVVTGASGFIGAATVSELIASGHEVTVLLRKDSNSARLTSIKGLKCFYYTSLNDNSVVSKLKESKPGIFIHCAWRGVSGQDRNEAFQVTDNIRMAMDSVELAASLGCGRWVGLGSQAEYGNQNRRLDESAPLLATTLYGKAKLATGIACLALAEARGISGAWIRVFSTYGPGDSPHWFLQYVLREFRAARAPELTLCTQLWDYLHVADAARAIVAIATAREATGNFNLGSGKALPLRYWLELLRNATKCPVEPKYGSVQYRPDQVMHLEADISRIVQATGWRPRMDPVDGVASLVQDF